MEVHFKIRRQWLHKMQNKLVRYFGGKINSKDGIQHLQNIATFTENVKTAYTCREET